MNWPGSRNLSVRLMWMSLTSTLTALALAFIVLSFLEVLRFREETFRRLESLSMVLNANCAAAMAFDDVTDAHKTLRYLEAEPEILSAAIYRTDGKLFAGLGFRGAPSPMETGSTAAFQSFRLGGFILSQPVKLDGVTIGALQLRSSNADLGSKLVRYVGTIGGLALLSFLVSALVTRTLQRSVSAPLHALVSATRASASGNPLRLVQAPEARDEVAELVDAFNRMAGEIQRRELALSEMNQTLEYRVTQRTRELAQAIQEAQQARELAERVSESKSRFLNTVSHELRTPLTAIIGYTRLLSDELSRNNTEALKRDISTVEFSARHLLGLINNTLDLSKIEAGKMEVRCEEFAPRPVLLDCAKMFGPLFDEKGNRLILQLDELPDLIFSDKSKIRQILFNLLSNAGKFTENGTITMTSRREPRHFILEIQDTGCGMDAEHIRRAFEPFESNLGNRLEEGTGLGLTIVQAFCQLLHGSLELESAPGKGTTCRVRLPEKLCISK